MRHTLALLFTLFALVTFGQTKTFIGIGAKLQLDSTTLGYKAVKITEFVAGGAAEHSGLKIGDLILKVDDKSAVKLPLDQVTKMIVGEEGTTVKIEVNQKGQVKTFSMVRKKLESVFQYSPSVNSDFCNTLTKLMNDGPYYFRNIIDTTALISEGGFSNNYKCKVSFPGMKEVYISRGIDTKCVVTVGTYKTTDALNTATENTLSQIRACYPRFDYFSYTNGDNKTIEAGLEDEKSFTSPILSLHSYRDKRDDLYHLQIEIEPGELKLFLTNTMTPQKNDFANALRTIYGDVENNFKNIKGAEHESGGLFNTSYWYDVNLKMPGAANCYIDMGDMTSMAPPQCIANFFLGEKEEGKVTLNKFFEIIYNALGADFVNSPFLPEQLLAQVIPSSAEEVYTFAKKTHHGAESIPVMSLVYNKEEDGRYRIYLCFFKAIF